MGNISIMARRFSDGHVQYGWSGNGGYYSFTGAHLLEWYQNSDAVEYLFGLGQTACVGRVGSENGGCSIMETNAPTGRPFWLGNTEREIFSKINWIDYGYFYDLDHKWYYIIPGPFRIKLPLELVKNNLDKAGYEFEYRRKLEDELLKYILDEYRCTYSDFNEFIKKEGYDLKKFNVMASCLCTNYLANIIKFLHILTIGYSLNQMMYIKILQKSLSKRKVMLI